MGTNISAAESAAGKRTIKSLVFFLVVSVGLNAGLAYKLRQFLDAQEAQVARAEARRLKQGTAVPALAAKRVEGNIVETISYVGTDRPTVLYVLSPRCGWCARNENSIKKLIAEKRDEYRFVGISLVEEGAQDYAVTHELGIPLYTGVSEDTKAAYKMGGTPQTIVVSPKGIVLANWNGAYLSKQKNAVEDFFKVKLPDIDLKTKATH